MMWHFGDDILGIYKHGKVVSYSKDMICHVSHQHQSGPSIHVVTRIVFSNLCMVHQGMVVIQ